ncbi:MAG: glycosyltransferase family 4 protein [Aquificaceae bacterium]
MKIAWLNGNPNPNFGGTELHTIQMVKGLSKEGIEVVLICAKGSYVDKHTEDIYIKKYHLSFPNSLAIISTMRLAKLLMKEKPQLIIANNGKEYVNALLAGRIAGIRVAFFRHMERMKEWMVRRFVFPYVDRFFAVSEHVKENLIKEGVKPEKIKVIYNLVEGPFDYVEKEEGKINFLFVGKVDKGKGVFDFLEAFYKLSLEREGIEAYVVGDGKATGEVKSFIENHGLKDKVHLVGYTPRVEHYYKMAHICVIPSRNTEAMPRVAIEALAYGCALVVSDVGGTKEAVERDKNGYVFKAGDVGDLKESMNKVIERWKEFSIYSYNLYRRKFSEDTILKNFIKELKELIH